ncbi:MAG: redoxin domain-containing protein [Rhizobiales bacterium]|nr:redoxin domain-containing protein [Hyphomicrobiales bacterium]
MAVTAEEGVLGSDAPLFVLPGVDGGRHALADLAGERGTVVAFICNHCPYVVAVIDRLVRDARDLAPLGVATIAICSNDARAYPDDSFENMKTFAERHGFTFPYLHDENQDVARAFGAVCTPDLFGYDGGLKLRYRGRIDASRREPGSADLRRDLFEAMREVAKSGRGPAEQFSSMGCSIKWRDGH